MSGARPAIVFRTPYGMSLNVSAASAFGATFLMHKHELGRCLPIVTIAHRFARIDVQV